MAKSCIISLWDLPRVFGMKIKPKIAHDKHIVPNIIRHPDSPIVLIIVGNIVS